MLIGGLGSTSIYCLGVAASQVTGARWFALDSAAISTPARTAAIAPAAIPYRDVSARTILDANAFDSVTGPIHDVLVAPSDPLDALAASSEINPCSGGARVAISVVDPARRHRSMAVLALDSGGARKAMVREGNVVAGRRVAAIARERVYLHDKSSYCYVGLETPIVATSTIASVATSLPPLGSFSALSSDLARGIRRVDPTHVQVDRLVLDSILDNQAEHLKSARVAPEMQDGRMIGVRMLTVRADTVLDKLGLQGGDVLTSINGFPLTSVEEGLAALGRLRTSPSLALAVVRYGTAVVIDYEVR
ncbi:MAG: type II secretion system protein GspC [Polyangiales bacterium]